MASEGIMLLCEFEGHPGFLAEETGVCVFYGITFASILDVAKYLKDVSVGPEYEGVIARGGVKLLLDPEMGTWWSAGRWWPDKRSAVMAGKRMFR